MKKRVLVLAILVLACGAVLHDAWQRLDEPLNLDAARRIEVAPGSHLGALLQDWDRAGLFRSPRQRHYLAAWARLHGIDRRIHAGEYELVPGMRPLDLAGLLVSGRVVLHELRLIEGWRVADALAAVRAEPALRRTLPDDGGEALMRALGQPDLHPEGRFFPDTYRFAQGTSDVALLRQAYLRMQDELARAWAGREPGLPLETADEALVLASIVEKETGAASERAQIAGVFLRRLRIGMRLQTDPTVIYGLGDAFDGNLRKRDLLADGPYNTYTRGGLPPSPICLPGAAALRAAVHPDSGKTLYFVARGDGYHVFSETLAEHQAAVRKYQLKGRRR